ncbi:MAG: hypothetical protein VX263_04125 [Bacteroidota bacterium]|uniref:Uncharacterized protein n=1 Tax=marine metagenome TaxID=408172 RepID=A0A381QQY7_9ZZZZ|nr:hypothetical protein [Bacteroidota bacterium]
MKVDSILLSTEEYVGQSFLSQDENTIIKNIINFFTSVYLMQRYETLLI